METCCRKIHFCYGHRVMNHESKCATLHGHNGIIWVHATPIKGLDSLGRVIDFSVLKEKVGGWVDTHWDHTMIIFEKDEKTIELLKQAPSYKLKLRTRLVIFFIANIIFGALFITRSLSKSTKRLWGDRS